MTQAASGTSASILAPGDEGAYRLYVIDAAGNISNESAAALTVDNTAPTNQDSVFASGVEKRGETSMTIVSSGQSTNEVWFAPSGTSLFSRFYHDPGSSGTSTSISAPGDEGTYVFMQLMRQVIYPMNQQRHLQWIIRLRRIRIRFLRQVLRRGGSQ